MDAGLIGKLNQFKRSPVVFLLPDVICGEIKRHLEKKIRESRSALEKSINEAGDHIFFDGSTLNEAKSLLLESKEIEGLTEKRLNNFIENTGAVALECGDHLSVSELLKKYFSNAAPFSESGKKKNEFPDAIVLMAVDEWAKKNNCSGLIPPDTLMRDNNRQPLRCHYDSETQLQTIPERIQRRGGSAGA